MTSGGEREPMDARQVRIFDWFMQVDTGLAELYHGAVRLLKDESFPGRGRFICHCVREIRNRLPNAVAGKATLSRLDYTKEINKLARAYDQAGLGGVHELKEQGEAGQWVGRDVLTLLEEIIKKHKEVKDIKRENAKLLLMELEPENMQLQQSLAPVVANWIEETEWFVERVHEGEKINESELVERFGAFEEVLISLVGHFYEGLDELEKLVEATNRSGNEPDDQEVDRVVRRLGRPKYRIYFFDKLTNARWIEPLKQEGFFKSPPEPKEGEAYERWPEGWYLKRMSAKAAEKVLWVISEIESRNPYVRAACMECLLEMPEKVAAKGVSVVTVVKNTFPSLDKQDNLGWIWCGEKAAELMVKLSDKHPVEAFKISWILLDAWVPQEQKGYRDIKTKFTDRDYRKLVLNYFNKLWEVNAWKALWIMVKILNRCLEHLDENQGYDVSRLAYAREALRNLDSIDVGRWGIEPVLVKGICEAGKLVSRDDPSKLSKMLDIFEEFGRAIFLRIEMYLLRFVGTDIETVRINKIISEKKYLGDPCYENEYKLLLQDKFDVVEESRKVFETWVQGQKIEDLEDWRAWFRKTRDREANDEDIKKYVAGMKARQLFLVKEKYADEYATYQSESGLTDADLAPRPMVSKARPVSPMEGTPLELDEMGKMSASEVLEYVSQHKNYEAIKKPGLWENPAEALRSTFKADVKKRIPEYLGCDSKQLEKLHPDFLGALFYGIWDTIRDRSFPTSSWTDLIKLAHSVVQENSNKAEYRDCFLAMLSTFRDGFTQEEKKIQFDKLIIVNLFDITKSLVRYEEDYQNTSEERDPMQMRCTSVKGEALEQVIMLGIVCKKDFPEYFKEHLTSEIRKLLDYVVNEVKKPEVNCTLGDDFERIGWLDEEWLQENVEKIFEGEMWDVVWGTLVSWGGRPSRLGFEMLADRGIYEKAIGKLGTPNKFRYGKDPEEGFVEHLMIAFFNGWINVEDTLLKNFFDKASSTLRGYAAQFLTTGFESLKKESKDHQEFTQRLRAYWQKRLTSIREKPSDNIEEARELTGWIKDSLLEPKDTLELLEQTLDVSQGNLGKMRDTQEFVDAVCNLGNEHEVMSLRCLKKASAAEDMRMPWARYQDRLIQFLESIADLPDNYDDIDDIRTEAIAVADAYGRLHPEKFREVWLRLSEKGKKEQ
jgi:hypothetical protein